MMKKMLSVLILFFLSFTAAARAGAEPARLSLEEAVSIALEKNLGLRLKKQEFIAAEGGVEMAYGAFDPLASATAFYGDSRGMNFTTGLNGDEQTAGWSASVKKKIETGTAFDMTWENYRYETDLSLPVNPAYSSSLSLGVTQPLLKGWGEDIQTAKRKSAEKLVEAAGEELSGEAVDLGAFVAKAYWELLFAHQNLEVRKLSLQLAESLRDNTAEKIEAGILAPVEIYQPESEVALREQGLIEGERAISRAEDTLKLLMNDRDWDTPLMPVDEPSVDKPRADLPTIIEHALTARQDILAAERKVEAVELAVRLADDSVRPSLDLSGRMGLTGVDDSYSDSIDEFATSSDLAWRVGLTFSVPLGNRYAKGDRMAARADLEKARTALAQLRQEVVRSARDAVRNERLALKNIEASGKTALALKKSLEAEENKLEAGLSTVFDVLKAQEAYAQGLVGEKRALIDYALARTQLNQIQGVIMTE